MRLRFIQRYRLSYSWRYPDVEAQVTIVPPACARRTRSRRTSPGRGARRRCRGRRRRSASGSSRRSVATPLVLGVLVRPEPVPLAPPRSMTSSAPIRRQISAFSGLDTTHTGVAPPARAICVAYEPSPPHAPQMRTTSPSFMPAPLRETSCRYAVLVDQPGAGRLLPGEVGRLGHQLVGLDDGQLGQTAEVGLEAPDPLLAGRASCRCGRRRPPARRTGSGPRPPRRAARGGRRGRYAARRRPGRSRPRGTAGRAAWSRGRAGRSARGSRNVESGSKIEVQTVL